jgi:hypothetical protein
MGGKLPLIAHDPQAIPSRPQSAGPAAPPARIQSSISGCEFMAQTPIRILVI